MTSFGGSGWRRWGRNRRSDVQNIVSLTILRRRRCTCYSDDAFVVWLWRTSVQKGASRLCKWLPCLASSLSLRSWIGSRLHHIQVAAPLWPLPVFFSLIETKQNWYKLLQEMIRFDLVFRFWFKRKKTQNKTVFDKKKTEKHMFFSQSLLFFVLFW